VVLDPTSERQLATRELLARPKSIVDQTVGLLDIKTFHNQILKYKLNSVRDYSQSRLLHLMLPKTCIDRALNQN